MGGKLGEKKVRRAFTPEQKFEISKDIERSRTIKEEQGRINEAPASGHIVLQVKAAAGGMGPCRERAEEKGSSFLQGLLERGGGLVYGVF